MRSFNFKSKKNQKGVTLIELIIASALGVIVIIGVSDGMLAMTYSGRTQLNDNSLQDKGNTAMDYVAFQMRSALASPCDRYTKVRISKKFLKIHKISKILSIEKLMYGLGMKVETEANGAYDEYEKYTVNGQEVVTDKLTYLESDKSVFLDSKVNFDSTGLTGVVEFPKVNPKHPAQPYVITNCKRMDVFIATKTAGKQLTFPKSAIMHPYKANTSTRIAPLFISSLYVKNQKLYRKTDPHSIPSGPLVDGIEAMRFIFSVDTETPTRPIDDVADDVKTAEEIRTVVDNFESAYVSGKSVIDNMQVVAVDIYLLVRAEQSDNASVEDSYTLQWPGRGGQLVNLTFTDQVPRKVLKRTVVLRNNSKML